jgi:hypothetical protein
VSTAAAVAQVPLTGPAVAGVEQAVAEHVVFVARRDVAEQVDAGGIDLGLVGVDERQQILKGTPRSGYQNARISS